MKPEEDPFGKPGEHIRVYFDHDESGHALYLGHGLVQIKNIPMTEKCGLNDIATIKNGAGFLSKSIVDEVVHRCYDHKTAIYYDTDQEFYKLALLLSSMGCAVAGVIGADEENKKRGLFQVQYNDPINPLLIAEGFGVKNPEVETD